MLDLPSDEDLAQANIHYVSPGFVTLWNAEPGKVLGRSVAEVRASIPDFPPLAAADMARIDTEDSIDIDRRIKPNGEVRWLRTTASAIRDDRGKLVRIAAASKDATRFKGTTSTRNSERRGVPYQKFAAPFKLTPTITEVIAQ